MEKCNPRGISLKDDLTRKEIETKVMEMGETASKKKHEMTAAVKEMVTVDSTSEGDGSSKEGDGSSKEGDGSSKEGDDSSKGGRDGSSKGGYGSSKEVDSSSKGAGSSKGDGSRSKVREGSSSKEGNGSCRENGSSNGDSSSRGGSSGKEEDNVMRTETAMIHKETTVEMAASKKKVTILLEDRAVMTRGKDAARWRTPT